MLFSVGGAAGEVATVVVVVVVVVVVGVVDGVGPEGPVPPQPALTPHSRTTAKTPSAGETRRAEDAPFTSSDVTGDVRTGE
jgi:hypothetical protein